MRWAAKRDDNEAAIVDALEHTGCLIQPLSAPGVPDLLVWSPFTRSLLLLEVKDGAKVPSARKLTDVQVAWHRTWSDAPIFVCETVEQALRAVGVPT